MNFNQLLLTTTVLLCGIPLVCAETGQDQSQVGAIHSDKSLTLSSIFRPMTEEPEYSAVSSLQYTFSGDTADSIDYIQLCKATGNTCTSCGAPVMTITTGTPIPYSTTGTTYSVRPTAVASYLSTNGFSGTGSPTYYIGMYVKSTKLVCSSSSAYCSTKKGSNDALLCMQATYNGTDVTALSQTDDGNAKLSTPTTQYLYQSMEGTSRVSQYTLATNGTLSTPSSPFSSVSFTGALGVAFATAGVTKYAYTAAPGGGVLRCAYATSTGIISTCAATPSASAPSWRPQGIATITLKGTQYAYVPSATSLTAVGSVYRCQVASSGGGLTSCAITPSSGAPTWTPRNVAFAAIGSNTYAYIASSSNSVGLYRCAVDTTTGGLSSCTAQPLPTGVAANTWLPTGVAITTVGGTRYAYVAVLSLSTVYKYTVGSDGALTYNNVTPSAKPTGWATTNINIGTVNGTQYAYVVGNNTGFFSCAISTAIATKGNFSTCTSQTLPGNSFPRAAAFSLVPS